MKHSTLLFILFLLAGNMAAQDAKPVVIVSTTGKVALIPQGQSKASPLKAGAVAKNTGKLKLGKKAFATVYCDGQFKDVTGNQTIELSTICAGNNGTRAVNADYDFGNKLMAAVEMVAVGQQRGDGWATALGDKSKAGDGWGTALGDKSKAGDGWGTALGDKSKAGDGWGTALGDKSKAGDGWGGKGTNIRLIMPFGKLRPENTTFFWSKPATTEAYQLNILDGSGKIVHSVNVRDTFVTIDLKALSLSYEDIYRWKISAGNLVSNELEFGMGDDEDWASTLEKIKASPLNTSSQDPVLPKLIEAVSLENDEWCYAAYQIYADLQKQKPGNLAKMMYGAFWARYNFFRLAETVMK
ncbi:MAG: hypothetical protein SFV22_12725 [Saprospiraceae bacterium]|nr:hypothetical protein [Saprospiraceae bacterium]